ncbi:hypothetical protein GCM10008956_20440 [Deinococcus arenae]|uniref:Uncharacterized protein n=1 Tax=Deinococcus arenae TaxID=1452751 RepID=A0A8H9L8Q2_9DEIO|nr:MULTISPECIES: hypothetical protein [Deinococcus]AWT35101.1 hypothetical protein DM785_05660 [Deinococcus actinosclerus]GGM44147.1 hypothetical protein GCM10008956_20440 [Deinococcus arenae]
MPNSLPLPARSAIRQRLLEFAVDTSLSAESADVALETLIDAYEDGFRLTPLRPGVAPSATLPRQGLTFAYFLGTLDRSLSPKRQPQLE